MRSLLLATLVGLIVIGAAAATRTALPKITAPPESSAAADMPAVPADLGKSIRAYLMANPEVLVEAMQTISVAVQAPPVASSVPLMFHCHILEHEDAGMMGQFVTT